MDLRLRDYRRIQWLAMSIIQNYQRYVQNRWDGLTPELQRKEPHSFHNFVNMFERLRMYIRISEQIGVAWLLLTFHPPILLYPVPYWIGEKSDKCRNT